VALLKQAERIAGDDLTLLGEIAAAQAFLAQVNGDGPGLVAHSEKALALLPKDNLSTRSVVAVNLGLAYWHLGQLDEAQTALEEALYAGRETGNMYAAATAEVFLARSQAVRGHLHSAAKWLQSFLEYGIQAPITALVHLDLTTLYYEWNDLENARKHLEAGEEIANRGGNPEFQAAVYLLDARIQHARCDHARALAALQKAAALVSSGKVPDRTGDRIRALELELGFISPVNPKDFPKNVDAHPFYRYLGLVEARWRIAKGEFQQAIKLLRDARDQAEKADWGYGLVVIDTLTALAAPCETLAVDHLTQALERAQPEGYLRTFVDVGPVLEPILKVAARQGRNPVYVGKILAVIQSDISETDHRVIPSAAKMIEPLTDREMEVLRLVAAGMTNRAIADQLIVSISTVKSHVHHICGKLAASNRTEAVARGRELGLV
jgi:LuxR family maltose regulon positive regulatory protein